MLFGRNLHHRFRLREVPRRQQPGGHDVRIPRGRAAAHDGPPPPRSQRIRRGGQHQPRADSERASVSRRGPLEAQRCQLHLVRAAQHHVLFRPSEAVRGDAPRHFGQPVAKGGARGRLLLVEGARGAARAVGTVGRRRTDGRWHRARDQQPRGQRADESGGAGQAPLPAPGRVRPERRAVAGAALGRPSRGRRRPAERPADLENGAQPAELLPCGNAEHRLGGLERRRAARRGAGRKQTARRSRPRALVRQPLPVRGRSAALGPAGRPPPGQRVPGDRARRRQRDPRLHGRQCRRERARGM